MKYYKINRKENKPKNPTKIDGSPFWGAVWHRQVSGPGTQESEISCWQHSALQYPYHVPEKAIG